MSTTVIVPTFNEGPNVAELVRRVADSTEGLDVEVLFVDDSNDDTPEIIADVAKTAPIPVRLLHREDPVGGLSGAVVEGMRKSTGDWCLVMDGDLQHPPEMIPVLLNTGQSTNADVVVASRYCGEGGDASGLDGRWRHLASKGSAALARSMFPKRLRNVTDPMTGFFAVRREAIDLEELQPQGFKILLEILARNKLVVVEEPFVFGERYAGTSKATLSQGMRYLRQLAQLRFGRLSKFALIGAGGTVLNLVILAVATGMGMHYRPAYVMSSVVTILINFVLQEIYVFHDLRNEGKTMWRRFAQSMLFNGGEALVRYPFYALIVAHTPIPPTIAQAILLLVAFVIRFVFLSRVVYRPKRTTPASPLLSAGPTLLSEERESETGAN